ncbi:MAG: YcgL domain-containing protein [Pseudomonadales bacterium]|jgi:uncharacterized protein YcgL (UPF0745 family)
MNVQCDVYKSDSKEGVYLYVDHDTGLEKVPQELLDQFKQPELALSFTLDGVRTLAKEDPVVVLNNLESQGYHLQLPPVQRFIAEPPPSESPLEPK